MWVPPEDKDPILLLAPTRKSVSLFGAVNLRNGKLVTQFEKKFNAMTFKDFLCLLLRHRRRAKKMVILLDNAKYHHAAVLKPFLKRHRDKLALEFLPAYSPELNPIERVWKLTRRLCTHKLILRNLKPWLMLCPDNIRSGMFPMIHYANYAALFKTLCIVTFSCWFSVKGVPFCRNGLEVPNFLQRFCNF